MRKTIAFVLLLTMFQVKGFAQLTLPFFDDFAKSDNLDGSKWLLKGGVFVNNTFSRAPLTRNIATFNAVSMTGKLPANTVAVPYSSIDTLTSQPIDLSSLTPSDSVYLSFYLQAGGGVWLAQPTMGAAFLVEFKDNTGVWQQGQPAQPALRINGPVTGFQDFAPVSVAVKDPVFFHSSFQFRFRNIGRNRFESDSWNMDYVYLNKNRNKLKADTFDIATSLPLNPILKQYSAMPIHQFNANITGEIADGVFATKDGVTTTLNNLGKRPRSVGLYAKVSHAAISAGPFRFSGKAVNSLARQVLPDTLYEPNPGLFANLTGFQDIKNTIYMVTNESGPETRYNDTISRVTPLHDYYAYDDGSAEGPFVASLQTGLQQVAVKYKANQADHIKELSVYMPRLQNTKGATAIFRIWTADANGKPNGQGIFTTNFVTPDPTLLNNWITIPVNPPVAVNGDFFVGWSVSTSTPLFTLGNDRNAPNHNQTYYFSGVNTWTVFPDPSGVMIRPVMNNNITGISEDQQVLANIKLYPNPASSVATIQGEFEKGTLLDATGRQVREFTATDRETQLNVQNLPTGLYLVKLQTNEAIQTYKLLINSN